MDNRWSMMMYHPYHWWHRHTSLKLFWPQPMAPWTTDDQWWFTTRIISRHDWGDTLGKFPLARNWTWTGGIAALTKKLFLAAARVSMHITSVLSASSVAFPRILPFLTLHSVICDLTALTWAMNYLIWNYDWSQSSSDGLLAEIFRSNFSIFFENTTAFVLSAVMLRLHCVANLPISFRWRCTDRWAIFIKNANICIYG